MSMSQSSGQSSSASSTLPVQTPENDIINSISNVASNLAANMVSWAQSVFAQTSQITNQAVGNFFDISNKMEGLSTNLTNQYNNLFAPENAQLVADANSYNSAARQGVDMGMAGATQAQAGDAALENSEASLRSYGINPADGRYAALDKAAAVQNAANIAGAENMQRNTDTQIGQALRTQAVQVGAQLPAAIANVNNTAIQANTGASNAELANANTGVNLNKLPDDFLNTAMQVKMPFSSTLSSSRSNQQSSSNGPPQNNGQGSNNGGGQNGGGGGGSSPSNMNPALYTQPSLTGGGVGLNPSAAIMHIPQTGGDTPPGGDNTIDWSQQQQAIDDMQQQAGGGMSDIWNQVGGDNIYQPEGGAMSVGPAGDDSSNIWNQSDNTGLGDFGNSNPMSDGGFGQTIDPTSDLGGGQADLTFGNMGGGTDTQYGNISYDPSANQSTGFTDPTASDNTDTSSVDYNSSDSGGDYASGGAIDASLSPSGGRKVDDIKASGPGGQQLHMNANEFVIPQDVALWKGQEFFQNLIDQSRKKRVMASAQPSAQKPKHALNPAFAQRRIGASPMAQRGMQ